MFDWLKKKSEACRAAEMPQVDGSTDLRSLLNSDLLILFKHSTACPVSWAAHSQINRFRSRHPEVPVRMLKVIQERPISLKVAEMTGVRHESPQVIVISHGSVAATYSHGSISEARLTELVTAQNEAPVTSGHPAIS